MSGWAVARQGTETAAKRFSYDEYMPNRGGRPKSETPARARSFWLTDDMMDSIDERAREDGVSRSELVRQALQARLTASATASTS